MARAGRGAGKASVNGAKQAVSDGEVKADQIAAGEANPASEVGLDHQADPAAPNSVSPELLAKIGEWRSKIQLSVGQIVLAIMNLPRYRHQTLADLSHLVMNPLLRDRLAIAYRGAKAVDGLSKPDQDNVAGFAIWASVSDAVDAAIADQVKAGTFPVRLGADDWASGENVWLLDVIAGDQKAATAVLANFRQVAGERTIKVHPIVGRLIEPEVLEKMRARGIGANKWRVDDV